MSKSKVKLSTTSSLVAEEIFNGRPVIRIKRNEQDNYPFTFGIGKAELIVNNYDAIKAFVEKHKE